MTVKDDSYVCLINTSCNSIANTHIAYYNVCITHHLSHSGTYMYVYMYVSHTHTHTSHITHHTHSHITPTLSLSLSHTHTHKHTHTHIYTHTPHELSLSLSHTHAHTHLSLLKNFVGKDVTKIALPVHLNEPLSFTQVNKPFTNSFRLKRKRLVFTGYSKHCLVCERKLISSFFGI